MTIDVYEIPISKHDLEKWPADERVLFILVGHASNQIVTLVKFSQLSLEFPTTDNVHSTACAVQTHTLLRLLFGSLAEGYELIRTRLLSKAFSADLVKRLDPAGSRALKRLKKYFGSPNAIIKARNHWAFHYPNDELVESAFQASPAEDGAWCMYLSEKSANSLYLSSDLVISHGLIDATSTATLRKAFEKMMDDALAVANSMTDLLMSITQALVTKHMPEKIGNLPKPHKIADAPKLKGFSIPFFLEQ